MTHRQITDTKHFKLLRAIHVAGGVPCEPYPELFFPEDLHAKNIRLFDACTAAGITGAMDAQAKAAEIFHPRHSIYGQLFELQTLEVVRLIEGGE